VKSGSLKCGRSPGAAGSAKSCGCLPRCCAWSRGVLWGRALPSHSGGRGEQGLRACCWVCPVMSCGAVVPLGLLSGRMKGGKEGRSSRCLRHFLHPLFLHTFRVPAAWTGPQQHGCSHGGQTPASQYKLLWKQTKVRVLCWQHLSVCYWVVAAAVRQPRSV